MVPEGWRKEKVSNILERVVLPVNVEQEKLYREIGIRSHGKGIFHKEPVTGKSLGNKRVFYIKSNCFVVNIVFAWEHAVAKTTDNEKDMIASHRFPMYRPKGNTCDIDYILYLFKTKYGKYLLGLASPGGAGRNKTLGQNEFARLEVLLPPINEQIKIASVLLTWDKAIDVAEKLVNESKNQKKALMQQLLTGKKRFTGFGCTSSNGSIPEGWEVVKLKELGKCMSGLTYSPSDVCDESGVLVLRSSNVQNGRPSFIDNVFVDKEIKEGSITRKNDILICVRNGSKKLIGKNALLTGRAVGCAHGAFMMVFRTGEPLFVYQLFQTEEYTKQIQRNLGATINSINSGNFYNFKFVIPSNKKERDMITQALSLADKEVDFLQKKLDAIKIEKQSLMQHLLTGKIRVKVN